MKRILMIWMILLSGLAMGFPGDRQTALAAEKVLQMTVPECSA